MTPVITALAAVALVTSLAACQAEPAEESAGQAPAAPVEEATSEAGMAPTEAEPAGGAVRVLGIWGGDELTSFEAVYAPWQTETGNEVQFTGTRNITADLTIAAEGNDPPDVAIPAEIGLFQDFARNGDLVPLSACDGLEEAVQSAYPDGFLELGTVDGTLYGFFMKADTKGTVWYNPAMFTDRGYEPLGADATWEDLVALADQIAADGLPPWSIGLESGESSGWPGSDWIQQILLNVAGPEVYDGVIDGSVPYTDPAVTDAWERFGQMALSEGYTVQGSANGINATNFQDATYPPFESPPTAAMTFLGGFASGFIQEQFPDAEPNVDYAFFPFPGGGVTGGANIVYAFNAEPATCSFLSYLAGAEAQRIWVDRGGFTSVNRNVALDAYPNDIARAQAEQLLEASVFRFDLDDAVGGAWQQALLQGITQYLTQPDSLDDILANIEAAR